MKKNTLFKLTALLLLLCGLGDLIWTIQEYNSSPWRYVHSTASYYLYYALRIFSGMVKMFTGVSAVIPKTAASFTSLICVIASALLGILEAILFYYRSNLSNASLLVAGICTSILLMVLHPINLPRRARVSRLCIGGLLIFCGFLTVLFVAMHFYYYIYSAYVYIPNTHPLSLWMQWASRIALFSALLQLIIGIAILIPVKATKGFYFRCATALLNIVVNTALPWDQFGHKDICIWLPLSVAVSTLYLLTLFLFPRQKQQLQEAPPV